MALRGKEETFVRRFAAGGNDGVPFNPRGYGDHSRRFAARGNEIVDHENFRESCDGYHPRRFAARGNEDPDPIYDSFPVFDEYEDDVWYAWATGGSYRCGFDEAVRLNENSLSPKIADGSTKRGDLVAMEIPHIEPKIMGKLDDYSLNKQPGYMKIQNKEKILRGLSINNNRLVDCGVPTTMKDPYKAANIVVFSTGPNAITKAQVLQIKSKMFPDLGSKIQFGTIPHVHGLQLRGHLVRADLFKLVKLNMNEVQLDVPFDPGGFGSKTKLEDEFF
ncbi:uncharacterized protein LOC118490119 [Helianthus annuus]|uniref:uncharacterized protein LOC118490119 n=1 Tax=Helianthus annuus TaxID=4232 RepID=UPI001652CB05|nr:uncharacterized protein LOC118490119 [Helianthus annuus]